MKNRVATAILLIGIVLLGFVVPSLRWLTVLVVIVVGGLCVGELAALARMRGIVPMRKLVVAAVAAMVLTTALGHPIPALMLPAMALPLAFGLRMRRDSLVGSWQDIGSTLAMIVYVGLPLAAATHLFLASPESQAWLLYMLAVIWVTDTAALYVGMTLGRTPFFPRISPRKTWEGAIGGLIAALIPGMAVVMMQPAAFEGVGMLELAFVALAVSVLGQFGDLSESLLKRDAGVKDSGSLLPGHGGMLDRLDSILMATVPLTLWLAVVRPGIFIDGM